MTRSTSVLSNIGQMLVVAATAAMATACVSHAGFRQQYLQSRRDLLNGDWNAAARKYVASKEQCGKRDRVMYWLNLGTLQHYAGQWQESQENFVKAERAIQDLFTTSVTAEASKYTISETLAPYEGEDFEKVLLYYYTALNNVQKGSIQGALVEARRADEFLKKVQVKYERDKDLSTLYKEDAFMLWLVGVFYEVEGSYADAFAAYKRAFRVYRSEYQRYFQTPPPSYLGADVVRAATKAGLESEGQAFATRYGITSAFDGQVSGTEAEVIVIHGGGEAPFKRQTFFTAPMPDGYILRIAFPQMQMQQGQVFTSFAEIAGQRVETEMAEPISLIALKNFKHQLPGLKARAIVRATAKYVATQGTKKAIEGGKNASDERKLAGALIGLFGNIAAAASENADLRTWSFLPSYFRVARLNVPPGRHTLRMTFESRNGADVVPAKSYSLDLKAGERKIIDIRTVR